MANLGKDVEMNREGKNGYRTPDTKKAKRAEARVSQESVPNSCDC